MNTPDDRMKRWLATIGRALELLENSRETGGGMVIVHNDGSITEERWSARDVEPEE